MTDVAPITNLDELGYLVRMGVTDWSPYGDVRATYYDDLVLFNYTSKAQTTKSKKWNWFTSVSRGLMLNSQTGEVVARAFDKFWNLKMVGDYSAHGPLVEVTEKLDGSLGILYRHKGKFKIATRGSFTGPQAQWATEYLNDNFILDGISPAWTLLFEIIYPENRIVVNYGGRQDLVLIGARNLMTGYDAFASEFSTGTGFSLPRIFQFNTMDDIIAAAGQVDGTVQEGWVLRFKDGTRYKVKCTSYLVLHRIISQASFSHTIDAMARGEIDQVLETVPSELSADIKQWKGQIELTVEAVSARVEANFAAAPKATRKEYALWVMEHCPDDAPYMFKRLDEQGYLMLIYKREF